MKKVLLGALVLVSVIGIVAIKDVQVSDKGMLIEFRDETGYYIGE